MPFFVMIVVDYFNLPTYVGLKMSNINNDVFGVAFNAFVVIALYVITYVVLDKRQIEKDENAKSTANILMLSTYQQCKNLIEMVDNQQVLEDNIVPKIDFNKINLDNRVMTNLQNDPFIEHTHILELAENGAIVSTDLIIYLKIMELYKSFVSMRITFFDIDKSENLQHVSLRKKILEDKNMLNSMLEREMKKLQNQLKELKQITNTDSFENLKKKISKKS